MACNTVYSMLSPIITQFLLPTFFDCVACITKYSFEIEPQLMITTMSNPFQKFQVLEIDVGANVLNILITLVEITSISNVSNADKKARRHTLNQFATFTPGVSALHHLRQIGRLFVLVLVQYFQNCPTLSVTNIHRHSCNKTQSLLTLGKGDICNVSA
jgi:hypothetical protein